MEVSKVKPMQADIIYYHGDCVDGMAAAWVAWRWARKHRPDSLVHLLEAHYGKPLDIPENWYNTEDDVVMHVLDFSIPVEDLKEACKKCNVKTLYYIDHHPTGKSQIEAAVAEASDWGVDMAAWFDNGPGKSGASLAWDNYFPNEPVPLSILRVADRDTWTFKYLDSKTFHAYAALFLKDDTRWDSVFENDKFNENIVKGSAIRLQIESIVNKYTQPELHQNVVYGEYKGVAVNVGREFVSEVCNNILESNPQIDFVLGYQIHPMHVKFDFRARQSDDINVGTIAKYWGGGGHPAAAGLLIPKTHCYSSGTRLQDFLKKVKLNLF